jgi:cell division protein FtsZ
MAQKRQDPQEPLSQAHGTNAGKPAQDPVPHTREVIKVIGVGGGGGNALNRIANSGLDGVEFVAANTDAAHLDTLNANRRIVLGAKTARGLGAGANPEVGQVAAKESIGEIRNAVDGADMVFLTAGMGGGTGTGASPVIAEAVRESGALTVAVVTRPFSFEGRKRTAQAEKGIAALRDKVDALVVVPNDRLLELPNRQITLQSAFEAADDVLLQAVKGIAELVLRPGLVNVDFADVRAVMSQAGSAIMGIGEAAGEGRARKAALEAIQSPLMDTSLEGARGILFNVTGGSDVGIHEVLEIAEAVGDFADEDATIIWGHTLDPAMKDNLRVTVIATGFQRAGDPPRQRAHAPLQEAAPSHPGPVRGNPRSAEPPSYSLPTGDLREVPHEDEFRIPGSTRGTRKTESTAPARFGQFQPRNGRPDAYDEGEDSGLRVQPPAERSENGIGSILRGWGHGRKRHEDD